MSKIIYVFILGITVHFAIVPTCRADAPAQIDTAQAQRLIRLYVENEKPLLAANVDLPLKEITTDDARKRLGVQIFKVTDGHFHCDSFLLHDGKVERIGIGFGGWGVMSIVVTDFNSDQQPEILYAYSWGSGIHRSCLGIWSPDKKNAPTWSQDLCYWMGDFSLRKVNDQKVEVVLDENSPWPAGPAVQEKITLATVDYDKATKAIRVRLAENLDEVHKKSLKVTKTALLK